MVGCLVGRLLRTACAPCGQSYSRVAVQAAPPAAAACWGARACRRASDRARAWLSARGRQPASDRAGRLCAAGLAASWFSVLTVQSECDQVDFDMLVRNKIVDEAEEQSGWERLAAMYTLDNPQGGQAPADGDQTGNGVLLRPVSARQWLLTKQNEKLPEWKAPASNGLFNHTHSEMGGLTPELEFVASTGTAGMFLGGSLGAILSSRVAIEKFLERNQATAFETPLQAKRAMQDRVMIGMFRGFFLFGWRTAILTSSFALVSTTLMVYTNQVSALHYTAAGAVAGALYKINMGLRGMFAGALAGALLGMAGGSVISLVCFISGTTMPEIRAQQYIWKHQQALRHQARLDRKRERRRQAAEESAADQAAAAADPAAAAADPAPAAADPAPAAAAAADPALRSAPTASAARSREN